MFLNFKIKKNIGMTFLELIVVLGIFGAISATVLFNYGDFSANVDLQNLAQDVALQIKKTQTESVSGKIPTLSDSQNQNISSLVPADWTPSYGVVFTTIANSSWSSSGRGFIYYFNSQSDSYNDNGETIKLKDFFDFEGSSYQEPCGSAPESECIDEIKITSGDVIDIICFDFTDISYADDCTQDGTPADRAYISFERPRSNAYITPVDNGQAGDMKSNVFIRITSRQGSHRYVAVWQSGYISIQ